MGGTASISRAPTPHDSQAPPDRAPHVKTPGPSPPSTSGSFPVASSLPAAGAAGAAAVGTPGGVGGAGDSNGVSIEVVGAEEWPPAQGKDEYDEAAKGKAFQQAVIYGVINAIVGVPCMIGFANVIFSVRSWSPWRPLGVGRDRTSVKICGYGSWVQPLFLLLHPNLYVHLILCLARPAGPPSKFTPWKQTPHHACLLACPSLCVVAPSCTLLPPPRTPHNPQSGPHVQAGDW